MFLGSALFSIVICGERECDGIRCEHFRDMKLLRKRMEDFKCLRLPIIGEGSTMSVWPRVAVLVDQ